MTDDEYRARVLALLESIEQQTAVLPLLLSVAVEKLTPQQAFRVKERLQRSRLEAAQ